jgi:hypothetical protein
MNSFDLLKFRNQLLAESISVEENTINEDLSYLTSWKVLKGPGGYIFQIQGPNRDTIGARVNKAGMVTLDGEGAGAAQAVQQIANQFGTETEVLYGDDSLTTVISEPDFNAIFPDTISEAKMTRADEVGSDGVAEEDTIDESISEGDQYIDPVELEQLAYRHAEEAVNNIPQYIFDQDYFILYAKKFAQNFINFAEMNKKDLNNLDEGTLEEMASFYKLTDNSPEALAAIAAEKEKYKKRPALYNTLDALEKTGKADYKEFQNATKTPENPKGKDMATWNNTLSRDVLEDKLAAFIQAGRPVDPDKAAAPKEKSPKLKITNPKPKSTSTKLKDLAPNDVFSGMGPDEEEIKMDKEAMKAAKDADAELGNELGKVSGVQAAKDFLKRNASKTLNIVKKSNAGQELTSNEQKYLDKTRKLTSLIKKDKASFTASNISGQEEA